MTTKAMYGRHLLPVPQSPLGGTEFSLQNARSSDSWHSWSMQLQHECT